MRYLNKWLAKFKQKQPLLIFQMGKVGSRSIARAVQRMKRWQVIHIHQLNMETLGELKRSYRQRGLDLPGHISESEYVHNQMLSKGIKLKIITAVREPIARNFSAFFQNLDFFDGRDSRSAELPVDHYINEFIRDYPHEVPLKWFDMQMNRPLGIDVYRYPFPHHPGYQIIRDNGHEVLVLRCESTDAVKKEGLIRFLGVDPGEIPRVNIGTRKSYADIYSAFKHQIRLPESYIQRMCESEYTRHFYTEEEIAEVHRYWTGKTTDYPLASVSTRDHLISGAPESTQRRHQPDAVVIHQFGKVGSKSIDYSLKRLKRWPVYQTHILDPDARYFHSENPEPPAGKRRIPPHIQRARTVRFTYLDKNRPLSVITPVREPISRNVSAFFQNMHRFPQLKECRVDREMDRFLEVFLNDYQHDEALQWFDNQYRKPFGLDIFEYPFPHEKGYQIIDHPPHRFLLFRSECDDQYKSAVIGEFLQVDPVPICRKNESLDKEYAKDYRQFRDRLVLPMSYIDGMLSSPLAVHFYSEQEREAVRIKWLQVSTTSQNPVTVE